MPSRRRLLTKSMKQTNLLVKKTSSVWNIEIVPKYLASLPLETYCLIVVPCIGIMYMFLTGVLEASLQTIIFYVLFGSEFILIAVNLLYLYFLVKILYVFFESVYFKEKRKGVFGIIKNLLGYQVHFTLMLVVSFLFINFFLNALSTFSARSRILWATGKVAQYDYWLFGRDVLFWLDAVINAYGGPAVSFFLMYFYMSLDVILPVFLLFLFFKNRVLAKKFLLFFFLVQFLSMPLWLFFPTIDPSAMYVGNILQEERPERIVQQVQGYAPAKNVDLFQKAYFYDYGRVNNYLAVTAFPSMHTAWGFGMMIYAILLFWPLGLFFVPWFIMEITGAVYVGQHYVVDILLGIVIAVATYFLVEILSALEKRYYRGKDSFFIIEVLQEDARKCYRICIASAGKAIKNTMSMLW